MYERLIASLEESPGCNYTVQDAEHLADQVLELGGYLNEDGPVPIRKISNGFGFKVFNEDDMEDGISGKIFVAGTTKDVLGVDKAIITRLGDDSRHQRFVNAHELAHYLMDYIGNPEYRDASILFSKDYLKGREHHDLIEEKRADRFAAELLMPQTMFLRRYIIASHRNSNVSLYIVPYLSEFFEVKEGSVWRRIEELNIRHSGGIVNEYRG